MRAKVETMGETTGIEWADATFNPWIGCAKVSAACDHCYAEAYANRTGQSKLWGGDQRRRTSPTNWGQPLHWDRRARERGQRIRVFCASLADVFDNAVPPAWRRDLFELIGRTTNIDWLLLTKRIGNAERMMNSAIGDLSHGLNNWTDLPWPHVWIGATVIDQAEAERDIPKLLATPALRRFVSIEPMLGPINLKELDLGGGHELDALTGFHTAHAGASMPLPPVLDGLDWVIAGGESGHGARPMHPEWIRSLRGACKLSFTPFLFKQWGEWLSADQVEAAGFNGDGCSIHEWGDGAASFSIHLPKKKAGRMLDGRTWDGVPASALP
jgi:protein gp37